MASTKLTISNEMAQFDKKNRDFYDELDEDEKKQFAPFLMIRWGSTINSEPDLESYYVLCVNERLNKHFFEISGTQHKKLQWLLATTVSPGMGAFKHDWISPKKKEKVDTKSIKFLRELYPTLKDDELELMAEINDPKDLKNMAKKLGWDDKEIKKEL
jgi:hypothetical protein